MPVRGSRVLAGRRGTDEIAATRSRPQDRRLRTGGDAAPETAGSGVGIWSTPAIDLDRGLLFIGTGNTSAFGGVIGSAACIDGTLVMSSNFGDPATNG